MNDSTIKSTVGVQMSPEGMVGAAKQLDSVLRATINNLNKAASTSEKAIRAGSKAGLEAAQQLNGQLKALAVTLGQVKTLQATLSTVGARGAANAASLVGDFGDTNRIGKQVRAITDYRNSLNGASSAMTTLKDRVRQFDQQAGNLAKRGQTLSQSQIFKSEKIQETARAYQKVNNEIGSMRSRVALLSSDGQKAFKPMLSQLDQLEKVNAKAFSNRRRSNFEPEISATQKLVRNVRERLVTREKLEKASRLNLETLRAEGLQITRNSAAEREAALAKSVRAASSRFNNQKLLGTAPDLQRTTQIAESYSRVATRAATAQTRLNAALNQPNTSEARLAALIALHGRYQRRLGESIAAQNRLNSTPAGPVGGENKGGFFAGVKSSSGGLFNDQGEGKGFGAGALVGRVGAYALAASAVYGVISAIQEGIGFAIKFEDALAQLQAVSGSTSTEMERLSKEILAVSQNSTNSVLELTKSATIIAQAGFAGKEIPQLLESVVNLAGASGSSTDEAVDILTSTLGAFQLQASEATRVTDGLVAALNDSKLSVNQVQLGLQYVGATARLNDITFNELTATLGTMADAGIRSGSTMSTGLRQMLVDFIDPSEKLIEQLDSVGLSTSDIDVKTLGLVEVLQRLHDSGFQAYGPLETRAAAAYAVLSSNIPRIQELEAATLQNGAAQEAMEARVDSVNAQWQQMLNTLGGLAAAIGEDLSPTIQFLIGVLEAVSVIILTVIRLFTGLIGFVTTLGGEAEYTSATVEEFAAALERAGYSAEEAATKAYEMKDSLGDVETALKDTQGEMSNLQTEQASLQSETVKLIARQEDLAGSNGDLNETTASVSHQVNVLSSRFPSLRSEFAKTQGGVAGLISSFLALDRQASITMANLARTQLAQAQLNRQAALKEGGQIAVPFKAQFGTRKAYEASRNNNPQDAKIIDQYQSLIRKNDVGSYRKAQQFAIDNPRVRQLFPEAVDGTNRFLQKYDQSRNEETQSKVTLQGANFASSDVGAALSRDIAIGTGRAQRAASQGTADGLSRDQISAQLDESIKTIDILSKKHAGNEGVMAFLGQARASSQRAIHQLDPPETTTKKESGGSGRSKGGGNKRNSDADRLARETERNFARNEALIQREELEYRRELHENKIRMLSNAPTLDDIPDLIQDVDESLSEYLNAESESALAAIMKNNPTAEQESRLLATAARKAEQLREENVEKITGVLSEVIKNFVETSTDIASARFREATGFAQRNVDTAEAHVEGLSRPTLNSNVPDYFVAVKQREAELAQERLLRAKIPAQDNEINERQNISEQANDRIRDLASQLTRLGKIEGGDDFDKTQTIVVTGNVDDPDIKRFQELIDYMREYDQETQSLIDANDDLKQSFLVLNEVPTEFSDGLKLAYEAVKIEINSSGSLMQDVIKNLDEPLRTARGSFSTFFSDILTGSASVGQSIRNLLGSILESIVNLISQALANQAFLQLGNLVGLETGTGTGTGTGAGIGGGDANAQAATATATAAVAQGATTIAQGGAAVAQGSATLTGATGAIATSAGSVATAAATTVTGLGDVLVTIAQAMAEVVEAAAAVASSAAGTATGGEGAEGIGGLIAGLFGSGSFRGGLQTGRPKMRGGKIMEGLMTRDSVLTPTAQGEYVVRKAAVDSVGSNMLDSINARGADALKGVGAPSVSIAPAPVQTNLYVVSPENKPSLGPNDVIAIITNDVLKGGQTKKLIKRVANG